MQSLRNMFARGTTEKTASVVKHAGIATEKTSAATKTENCRPGPPWRPCVSRSAHSRGAAPFIEIRRPLPECQRGKVYLQREPGVLVRLMGRAPIEATVYELEKLRCNLCKTGVHGSSSRWNGR